MTRVLLTIGGALWMRSLAAELATRLGPRIVGVVIEDTYTGANLWRQLRKRLRRYGVLSTFDQVLLQFYLRYVHTAYDDFTESSPLPSPILLCESINDESVVRFFRDHRPDFAINLGGGLMRPEIFELPSVATVNLHTGITPRYRGANANFWALYEEAFDIVGVTAHLVDSGIDTGRVLGQRRISLERGADTLETVTLRAYRAGIDLVTEIIHSFEGSGTLPSCEEPDLPARTYGWYGLSKYLRVRSLLA